MLVKNELDSFIGSQNTAVCFKSQCFQVLISVTAQPLSQLTCHKHQILAHSISMTYEANHFNYKNYFYFCCLLYQIFPGDLNLGWGFGELAVWGYFNLREMRLLPKVFWRKAMLVKAVRLIAASCWNHCKQ